MKFYFPFRFQPGLFSLFILSLFSLALCSCQGRQDAAKESFGELDSLQIAADTTMQINMDKSYEYQKTLIENDTVVYDFTAYDKPKGASSPQWESKFIVIRRTSTKQDTIIKDFRFGPVKGLTLADLDQDGKPEILFYEDQTAMKYLWVVRIFKHKPAGGYEEIRFKSLDARSEDGHYRARDTFFVANNYLIRRYPYFEKPSDSIASADIWQSYKLDAGKLIFEKEKKVLQ